MKIVVAGVGVLGGAVREVLSERQHDVVTMARHNADVTMDMCDEDSVRRAFSQVAPFDAVASAVTGVTFRSMEEMTVEDYEFGLHNKLMGQVRMVLTGREFIKKNGSFTLIGGILDSDPIVTATSASMVNGALNAFVTTAAIELPPLRINLVRPTVLTESLGIYDSFFPGFSHVSAREAALAYVKSIEGAQTGQIYSVV